jgi:nucleoid-associated protein YgaU
VTDATIVVLVAAVPTTIASITAAVVAFASLRRNDDNAKVAAITSVQVAASNAKADTLIESTAKIHELTNSTNSNLQKALELMTEKAAGYERIISELREAKRDTAAAQAMTDQQRQVQVVAAPALVLPAADTGKHDRRKDDDTVLSQIEQHTRDTADNTARTDAAVAGLKETPPIKES